ncbi:MAG: hypothetical protein Q8Q60_00810 [Candidatus Chromulinivorax sp.]|nr:hypothetical protein [Candidatus Chromulinivorax sp.]
MKNSNCVILLIFFLLHEQSTLRAFDVKAMFEGMGTSFGAAPAGYTYSYEIWSDASVPIYTEKQGYASFMGAFFPSAKGYYAKKMLPSIFDSAGSVSKIEYHDSDYYFKMYIGPNSTAHEHSIYKQSLTQLPLAKNDPNIYYYHIYTSGGYSKGKSTHEPEVEMMGYQNPKEINNQDASKRGSVTFSSQLSAISLYNSSGTDVQVSLTYGTDPYTFTLEKYSYNTLDIPTPEAPQSSSATTAVQVSPKASAGVLDVSLQDVVTQAVSSDDQDSSAPSAPFSLRPNTLTFASYDAVAKKYVTFRTLMLPATGFATNTFIIEIFQDPGKKLEVGIQGFNPGNYDVPVMPRVRDLTPCPCTFWYQSFEEGGSIEGYGDLPGQVWVVYGGADNRVQVKVQPGQAFMWNLVRPLVRQGDQFVYFVYVITTDDAVAKKFVTKIVSQQLGKNIIDQYQNMIDTPVPVASTRQDLNVTGAANTAADLSLTASQEVAVVMGNLAIADGVIEDKDQGVIGYIVGTDIFTPKGLGFGRYYYTLAPSVISFANLVSLIYGCLDSSKMSSIGGSDDAIQKALTTTVSGWFVQNIKNPADVQKQVQQYLIGYGNSKIVDATTGTLTKYGQARLQSIMSGAVSLKYPSMKLSTVTNQFVYDFGRSAPEKMPEPFKQSSVVKSVASVSKTTATAV